MEQKKAEHFLKELTSYELPIALQYTMITTTTEKRKSNRLVNATSPYLLQHAYNPVDWYEWGEEALNKAKKEDKPILVSIGYSSCHWCHVMERECFEKENIATIMNQHFVCIKVDREERPDIDQIYMDAVQAMNVHGGWPLNVFLTPDQKPFYGGTYFPPETWIQVLQGLHQAYVSRRKDIEDSAEQIKQYVSRNDVERFRQENEPSDLLQDLQEIYNNLASRFDNARGGMNKAPKFVMPSLWLFLLRYHHVSQQDEALQHVLLTLHHISRGGLYDQIGGGFSRYSVDEHWFLPHFEKMLYDNAQLVSLYAEAYALTKDDQFKTIIYETVGWLQREMTGATGGFYSALDADSEGEEGKYYVWKKAELQEILGDRANLIASYYSVVPEGNWEHGNNILIRNKSDAPFLKENNLTPVEWKEIISHVKSKLLEARATREAPGLDDKIITAWNAMMVCGLIDAYKALGDKTMLSLALQNMRFLENELIEGTTLFRSYKNKRSHIEGFLDDYAYVIRAHIKLFEVTFDPYWIKRGEVLMNYTLEHFYDEEEGYFNYSNKNAERLIASKKEIFDNVIPSSNSVMAGNLLHLGIILDIGEWREKASTMTLPLTKIISKEPNYMSNWAIVLMEIKKGIAEVVIVGKDADYVRQEFQQVYEPLTLVMGSENGSTLPLIQDKIAVDNRPTLYVCFNKTCQLPVYSVEEARKQIKRTQQ